MSENEINSTTISTVLSCPKCQQPIPIVNKEGQEILCQNCGNPFLPMEARANALKFQKKEIGNFELLENVGLGSSGAVWRAHDKKLDRIVAIKIPNAGKLASAEEIERFFREGRTCAQLRHPAIVAVHEVGSEGGIPYLVSQFIRGTTLADYLKKQELTCLQAAQILLSLSEALEYAHSMGVIHRDIKPSNVMLEDSSYERGGDVTTVSLSKPLIMDFGSALRPDEEESLTLEGQILGTPAFMSPEQAKGFSHQVDARADVYGLGAMLYRLITGKLPFNGSFAQVVHEILHDEPRPPRQVNGKIDLDLETICLKAMAKEPGQRYSTAREFASDIRAYLNHEPIKARPFSPLERTWRWCQRKPTIAALTAGLALAFIAGFTGVTWQWIRAERNFVEAERQRKLAEDFFKQGRDAVDLFFNQLGAEKLGEIPGIQPLRRTLLESAVNYYQNFLDHYPENRQAQAEMAMYHSRIGDLIRDNGSKEEAIQAYTKALNLWKSLTQNDPRNFDYAVEFGTTHNKIGLVQVELGQKKEAIRSHETAVEIQEKALKQNSNSPLLEMEVSSTYLYLAESQASEHSLDAMASVKRAIELRAHIMKTDHSIATQTALSDAYQALARLEIAKGQLNEALSTYNRSKGIQEGLLQESPSSPVVLETLGKTILGMAMILQTQSQFSNSLQYLERAISIQKELLTLNPRKMHYHRDLSLLFNHAANIQRKIGNTEAGLRFRRAEIEILETLSHENATVMTYQQSLSNTYKNLAFDLAAANKYTEGLNALHRAEKLVEKLVSSQPSVVEYQDLSATVHEAMGNILKRAQRNSEAVFHIAKAKTIRAGLAAGESRKPADAN